MLAINNAVATSAGLIGPYIMGSVVQDAIETLKPEDGQRAVAELKTLGAKFITTDQALNALGR